MKQFTFDHEKLTLVFRYSDSMPVMLTGFSGWLGSVDESLLHCFPLVEIQLRGLDQKPRPMGMHYCGTRPGTDLRYVAHEIIDTANGRELIIEQTGKQLTVTSHLLCYSGVAAFRSWTEVTNTCSNDVVIEFVSSFSVSGFADVSDSAYDSDLELWIPYNSQLSECRWRKASLSTWGFSPMTESTERIAVNVQGAHNTNQYLPMGVLSSTRRDECCFWQIEHQGAWLWELATNGYFLCLHLSGPSYREAHWAKRLSAGQTYLSPKVSVGLTKGGVEQAFQCLTRIRRRIRRQSWDNSKCPVIFNDYMNCLYGNPTEAKLLPLIERAADVGCEVFCIDAGWYAPLEGSWSGTLGDWQVSETRFPRGLEAVIERIREEEMIPGIWLEPEVVGLESEAAKTLPDECFFMRHGQRLEVRGRYHLDFRHPKVIERMDALISRLVDGYGIGYIKVDFNSDPVPGTDLCATGPGDGMDSHYRAYTAWLRSVLDRYPDLILENCGSGGLRMNYDLLSLHSLQSVSDQTDFHKTAYIAAAAASAVAPEQLATWSYPLATQGVRETVFNMVNSLLGRVHLSGQLAGISREQLDSVKDSISLYRTIRSHIPEAIPIWPLGMPHYPADWLAYGLQTSGTVILAVWRSFASESEVTLELSPYLSNDASSLSAQVLYPDHLRDVLTYNSSQKALTVRLDDAESALLLSLKRLTE